MPGQPPPLNRPIAEKIAWACRCYQEARDVFLEERVVGNLLDRLEEAVSASRREMTVSGVVAACRRCEEQDGGSCCGAGIEDHYSSLLLLVNLLLGARIPEQRLDPSSCWFLGPSGCSLRARHTLCVNYLCKKATEGKDPLKITALRAHEGIELECLFHLQERIHTLLQAPIPHDVR
jgi:hypothetical protein